MNVLFVCLGNICRSPAAEAIFMDKIKKTEQWQLVNKALKNGDQGDQREKGNEKKRNIFVDSAGTIDHHKGERADRRMILEGEKRGVHLIGTSRPLLKNDGENFDLIFVMDDKNYADTLNIIDHNFHEKVFKMTQFNKSFIDTFVPDPYFGGTEGFTNVWDLLSEGIDHLILLMNEYQGQQDTTINSSIAQYLNQKKGKDIRNH